MLSFCKGASLIKYLCNWNYQKLVVISTLSTLRALLVNIHTCARAHKLAFGGSVEPFLYRFHPWSFFIVVQGGLFKPRSIYQPSPMCKLLWGIQIWSKSGLRSSKIWCDGKSQQWDGMLRDKVGGIDWGKVLERLACQERSHSEGLWA